MKSYNALNSIKIDLSKSGICAYCGRRFTDNLCTHATLEQIEYTKQLDKQADFEQGAKEQRQICAEMVAEVKPMFDVMDEALVTAYSIPEEMFPFIFKTSEGSDSPVNSHIIGLGVDFDVTAMGENARIRSNEIKSRMDERMEETKRKNQRGDELARQSILGGE